MNAIATVVSVQGNVFARSANGSMRKLAAGDTLLQGEIVIAAAGGHAELQMADGSRLAVNANESFQFGPETAQATAPDASEAAVLTDSRAATVIDPEQLLSDDPTAAGLTGGENSGNSFVRLLRIVEPITPLVFEYTATPAAELFEPFGVLAAVGEDAATQQIITVTPVNDLPAASNDSSSNNTTGQPVTINVLTNDSDPDGSLDPASVQLVGTANPGDPLVVPGEGTWTVNPATGAITFTPATGFTGDPTPISYTVADNDGNVSNPATVTIDYAAQPPAASNDSSSNNTTGQAVTINVLTNDSDPDGSLDPASVQIVGTANRATRWSCRAKAPGR